MSTVLVFAPHPDDETLGCGGSMLKWRAAGAAIHWVIATTVHPGVGYSEAHLQTREQEITAVAKFYDVASVHRFDYPAASLDRLPLAELIGKTAAVVNEVKPDTVLLPFRGDAHSDHRAVFDAGAACTKVFRYPFIRAVLAYETISETDFSLSEEQFRPNVFVDISKHLAGKVEAMSLYKGELGTPPFPRSIANIEAWATKRGAQAGCLAAEAFHLLKEIR